MTAFTQDQWIILALVFVLGILLGVFLTAGGRRKWKHRYSTELERREAVEREHREHRERMDEREKEWRERDALRGAAIRDRDGDGVRDDREI